MVKRRLSKSRPVGSNPTTPAKQSSSSIGWALLFVGARVGHDQRT